MAGAHLKRKPRWFRDYGGRTSSHARYERLSKADWADVFCDLFREATGPEEASAEAMLDEAERRLAILKSHGLR